MVKNRDGDPKKVAERLKKKQEQIQKQREHLNQIQVEKAQLEIREYNLRHIMLTESLKIIEVMCRDYKKFVQRVLKRIKWNNFVDCVKRPNIKPTELRNYMNRWEYDIRNEYQERLNWLLQVDQRSWLTQDLTVKDSTRSAILREQPVIGDAYYSRIAEVLIVLREIEAEILISNEKNDELKEIKEDFRQQLQNYFDLYTHRLIANVLQDMTKIDSYHSNYEFPSDLFILNIWVTNPVPQISKKWLETLKTTVNFESLGAEMVCPAQMEFDGYALRGIWMNFDHYSDSASSFRLKNEPPRCLDLRTSNEIEWNKRLELKKQAIAEMKRKRKEWEEKEVERLALEAEKSKKKGPKQEEKPKKRKRAGKKDAEPPLVTEATVANVDKEFTALDEEEAFFEIETLNPETLNLTDKEVNLRHYKILGGIYKFDHVKRPTQYLEYENKVIYHEIDNQLHYINFYQDYVPPPVEDPLTKNEKKLEKKQDDELDLQDCLINLKLKLTNKVFWWLEPMVCWWEPWEKSIEFQTLSPALQDFHMNYEKHIQRIRDLLFKAPEIKKSYKTVEKINDFNLLNIPSGLDLNGIVKKHIVPRLIDNYKFEVEIQEEFEILRKENLKQKEIEMEKKEENLRRLRSFEVRMEILREKAKRKRVETVNALRAEMVIKRTEEQKRLFNIGHQEKQIEKLIRLKEEADEDFLFELEENDKRQFDDFYDESKELEFHSMSEEKIEIPVSLQVNRTAPSDIFPFKERLFPIEVVGTDIYNNNGVENFENFDIYSQHDSLLLSTFLKYLEFLSEREIPIFKEPKQLDIDNENKDHSEGEQSAKVLSKNSSKIDNQSPRSKRGGNKGKGKKGTGTGSAKVKGKKAKGKGTPKSKESTPKSKDKKEKQKKKGKDVEDGDAKGKSIRIQKSIKQSKKSKTDFITSLKELRKRSENVLELIPHFPGKWTTSGIFYTEFDATKRVISFKTGNLGIFGLAFPKYGNYPIKHWHISPNTEAKFSIYLQISGNFIDIKIEITEKGYFINVLRPENSPMVRNKEPFTLIELKTHLQNAGVNFFPDRDASFYIQNTSEKHLSMEEHAYFCLAQFTLSHYFECSEYNREVDRRKAIIRMREIIENRQSDELMEIMITPQKCYFVRVVEKLNQLKQRLLDFQILTDDQEEFYPDIYALLINSCNELSKRKRDQMKPLLRYNVADLLRDCRLLSFE